MSSPTEQERKDALKWLEELASDPGSAWAARAIQAMLAEPRMPRQLDDEAVKKFVDAAWTAPLGNLHDTARSAYAALYEYISKPPAPDLEHRPASA